MDELVRKLDWHAGRTTRITGLPDDLRSTYAHVLESDGGDAVWHLGFAPDAAAMDLHGVTQVSVSSIWSALRFRYRDEIKRFTRRF